MGTISGMGFAQALVHTVHSTSAEYSAYACAKPIPEIVPMLKLDILMYEASLVFSRAEGIFYVTQY